jgi:hypothetical protein
VNPRWRLDPGTSVWLALPAERLEVLVD